MPNKKEKCSDIIKKIEHRDDGVILRLRGEIDLHCSTHLRGELLILRERSPAVTILDMTEVDFMDSSGLAVLVEALQWSRRVGTHLKLFGLHNRVRSIFEIARLDTIFDIYETEQEALAS